MFAFPPAPARAKDCLTVQGGFALYVVSKGALSKYVTGGCRRRFRLDLYSAKGRKAAGAVDKDPMRPGSQYLKEQGREHERGLYRQLVSAFGSDRVLRGDQKPFEEGEETALTEIRLLDHAGRLTPGDLVLEGQYEVTPSFVRAHGIDPSLRMGLNRPDIILATPPGGRRQAVTASGDIVDLGDGDSRTGLRIVDIKLASDPGPSHFAELAYYSMTLAAWLEDHGLADRFVVTGDAAIWPGKREGSALVRYCSDPSVIRTAEGALAAWELDLEAMPASVMLPRIARALQVDLRETLAEPDWNAFPVHVGERCAGCDYLGFPWRPDEATEDPVPVDGHCWPSAARTDNLSRVAGMTEGAAGTLEAHGIRDVAGLARLELDDPVLDLHQTLNTQRHVLLARARALRGAEPGLADKAGSSSSIPRFSDIRVSLSVEFDAASGDAFALGWEIVATVPVSRGERENPEWKGKYVREAVRDGEVTFVTSQDPGQQMATFHRFLLQVQSRVNALDHRISQAYAALGDADRSPTIQFYLWDAATLEQFRRMMGRFLPYLQRPNDRARDQDERMRPAMAWMFAPDTVLQDADHVSPGSPVTVVRQAIRLLALDLPHFYGQMQVANAHRHVRPGANREPYEYRLSYDFNDPLTDRIPSERGHEIWRPGAHPKKYETREAFEDKMRAAIRMRNQATLSIARKLAHDLNDRLFAPAPTVKAVFGTGKPLFGVAPDLQAIYQHARLMEAAAANEVAVSMAMTPFEREARFAAIRLVGQLHGAERAAVLRANGVADTGPSVHVFEVSPYSRDAKIKAGDREVSLLPEEWMDRRDMRMSAILKNYPGLEAHLPDRDDKEKERDNRTTLREACKAEILAFDRQGLRIVVGAGDTLEAFLRADVFDIEFEPNYVGVIDRLHRDYFVRPMLKPVLEAIGAPPKSLIPANRLVSPAILRMAVSPRPSPTVPVEDFVWDAGKMHDAASGRDMAAALEGIARYRPEPTPSQRLAIESSLSRRLSLLWGPPGTGKSATSKSILVGLLSAARHGRPVRIAITGPTWVAIDNIMQDVPELLASMGLGQDVTIARLKTPDGTLDGVPAPLREHVVETEASHERMPHLVSTLTGLERCAIIAGTASQLARLGNICEAARDDRGIVDFMLVDEASQMDVAHALVAFSTLAEGASVTVVGDDLQMSPIHPVEAPENHGYVFGSIYDFYARYRNTTPETSPVKRAMLNENFRSNSEIVGFFKHAGYKSLEASPRNAGHRARTSAPVPSGRPPDWPSALPWSEHFATILDPEAPLVAIIHEDRYASQRNEPEALLVAGMVHALRGRLLPIERREGRDPSLPLDDADFFAEGVGVVTPHRAQQAAVVAALRLGGLDPEAVAAMEASVDTVERFQGQQRVAMFASFGMGDLDQIGGEEEFLYGLNRFNVIVSRAQAKMVAVMSRRMAEHLPRDLDTLRQSHLLKAFVDGGHLRRSLTATLGDLGRCEIRY